MAEVQDGAQSVLAFVDGDDLRLDLARSAYRMHDGGVIALEQWDRVCLEPVEEDRIADETVLHDFRKPGLIFPRRKRPSVRVSAITQRGW